VEAAAWLHDIGYAPGLVVTGLGLTGCRLTAEQVHAELPWHSLVVLPEPESAIAGTAAALAIARTIQSG
jgi:hypothetical protein